MHHFLAIVTIGFGEIVRLLALNGPTELTGGANGIGAIPTVNLLGLKLDSNAKYLYFVLALVLLALLAKQRIIDSRVGRALQAVKCNPDASEAFGMKLSKKQELLALGSALYLVGLEVEGNRAKLQEIVDRHEGDEVIPITQELLDKVDAFAY